MPKETDETTNPTEPNSGEPVGSPDGGVSPPSGPEFVDYEVDGRKLKLDKSAAEAFTAERNAWRREIDTIRGEIRQSQAPKPAPVQSEDPYSSPDYDSNFFAAPGKSLKSIEDRAVERATKILTERYTTQRSTEMFWDDFYRENPSFDRAKDDWVTKAIIAERQAELAPLPVPEAKKRLAQYTSERLLDIHRRYAPKPDPGATTTLEGGSPPSRRPAPPKEEEPIKIGDYIRQKKEFRREAELKRTTRKEA